ncbi:hypothetical protein MMC11_001303 [Xylographa trunciseda]|nr:hypothetical protein [Xylographa trunciseda]
MAAAAAATDVSPHDFIRKPATKPRPITTDFIDPDCLVKPQDTALCPPVLPPQPLLSFYQEQATVTSPNDARISSARYHSYNCLPAEWVVPNYSVNVPHLVLVESPSQLRSISEALNPEYYSVNWHSRQLASPYLPHAIDSSRTDYALSARPNVESYMPRDAFTGTENFGIEASYQPHQPSDSSNHSLPGSYCHSSSTGPFGSLLFPRSEFQTQYGPPPDSATHCDTQGLNLEDPIASAFSSSAVLHPPITLRSETFPPQATHRPSSRKTQIPRTSYTPLVPQNDPIVIPSNQNSPFAMFGLGKSQEDVQQSACYTTTTVRSNDPGPAFSSHIAPQIASNLQGGKFQPKVLQNSSSTSFDLALPYRGSSHQEDGQRQSELSCAICRTTFISRSSLVRHDKEMHQHKGEYWCPPAGLVTKGNNMGVCAVCGHNDPDVDHFMTTHKFRKCYDISKIGVRRCYKRRAEYLQHLEWHDIHEGSICFNRDVRYAKDKGTYACGYCPTIFNEWTNRQEHLTDHLRDNILVPWDNSIVIEALLSQDFMRGVWRKLLSNYFSEGQPLQRFTWLEKETNNLHSSLEKKQVSAHKETIACDAFFLAVGRYFQHSQNFTPSNRFGLPGLVPEYNRPTSMLNHQVHIDLPGPLTLPRQFMSADPLNDMSLQANPFSNNDVNYPTMFREDHISERPFEANAAEHDDMDWT